MDPTLAYAERSNHHFDVIPDEVDALVSELERAIGRAARGGGDAIDDILESPRRRTGVKSVRHHEAVEAFRRELTDGLIRADTARQLLRLVTVILAQVV